MSPDDLQGKPAAERRLERWMLVVPHALLVVSLVIGVTLRDITPAELPLTLGLTLAAAVWIFLMSTIRPPTPTRRLLGVVYFVGLLAFIGILMMRSPWYGFFAWTAYAHAWDYLPGRWKIVGEIGAATVYITALYGGPPPFAGPGLIAYATAIGGISLLASVMGSWGEGVAERSEQRRVALTDLAEANRRLEELVRENQALQEQLVAQARSAGVLDERQRMAQEIHDTLAQGLTGVITQIEAAGQAAEADPAELHRHLDNAARLARESLAEARRSVRAIGPSELDDAHLPEAIADVAARWSALSGVRADVATTGSPIPLHPEVEIALLRVAQEALANVARHGQATRAGVTLSFMDDVVTLDVRDDGVGFDADHPRGVSEPGGFGLTAMRQRVQRVGGRLEVESEVGAGTAISASVPIDAAEAIGA